MQPAHMRRRPCLSLGVFCYLEFGGVKWQENLMRLRSQSGSRLTFGASGISWQRSGVNGSATCYGLGLTIGAAVLAVQSGGTAGQAVNDGNG